MGVNLFIIKMVLDDQVDCDFDFVQKLRDGSHLVKVWPKYLQGSNLSLKWAMDESEILERRECTNKNCHFFTFSLSKISILHMNVFKQNLIFKNSCIILDKNLETPHYNALVRISINSLVVNVLKLMTPLNIPRTLKCANCGGPHQSGSAKCSSLKETEILAYMCGHGVSYLEAKRKVEGFDQQTHYFLRFSSN